MKTSVISLFLVVGAIILHREPVNAEFVDDPFAEELVVKEVSTPEIIELLPEHLPPDLDHLVPIQPYPMDWQISYTKELTQHLELDEDYVARMIVRPSFGPEYSVRISGDKGSSAFEDNDNYFVTYCVSDKSIWYSMPENNDGVCKEIQVSVYRAPIPKKVARRVTMIWDEMIFGTRYPREGHGGLDGVTIEFSSRWGHGEAWSPRLGRPYLLWNLGEALKAYCKAPKTMRHTSIGSIEQRATTIETHLKMQANKPVLGASQGSS